MTAINAYLLFVLGPIFIGVGVVLVRIWRNDTAVFLAQPALGCTTVRAPDARAAPRAPFTVDLVTLGLLDARERPMGNRHTAEPFFTRGDKTTSIAFPADALVRFKAAAEAEGKSFNRWMYAAAEAYMKGHAGRERAYRREQRRLAREAAAAKPDKGEKESG